jgi:hypothetical protein
MGGDSSSGLSEYSDSSSEISTPEGLSKIPEELSERVGSFSEIWTRGPRGAILGLRGAPRGR